MIILPAIDLLDSKVVRLEQGVEQSAKIYSDDPLAFARTFEDAGAKIIHVVNLDGAFGRPEMNRDIIATLASKLHIPIELGGGIRSVDQRGWSQCTAGRMSQKHAVSIWHDRCEMPD